MLLGDVEDDRACLEQGKIAVLVCRDQAEGMKAQMRGFLLGTQRDWAYVVRLAHLFERPANPRVAREAGAAVGRPVPRGHGDRHREILLKLDLDHACPKQDRLVMVIVRLVYTAAVMVIVVSLLRAGNPVGGLVIVPAVAVWLRRDAESGRLAARVRRAIHQ